MPNSKETRKSPPKDSQSNVRVIDNPRQYLGLSHKTLVTVHHSKHSTEEAARRKGGKRRKTQKRRRTQKK